MNERKLQEQIRESGEFTAENDGTKIHILSIIGEVEGHECLSSNLKSTKYDQILPQLALVQQDPNVDGLLVLLNTVGGDVDAGLAIAEMIASVSKPSVSLVLGGSHSIGVPLAVSTDYAFIVPSGTVILHPVRLTGVVVGAPQTYEYFQLIQDRIVEFIVDHSRAKKERIESLMTRSGLLTKDLGTILVGHEAVAEGIIDEVGGISEACSKLKEMILHREDY